ncbi:RagB/SusD family nutrient uptake outer membrane protein, partial [Chitinophaga sp. SYP-B3965]|uniref:RagB/SusD family nutrient uptake outer membrane protein n=1 Tax=Chitinophaga sp. SYP-B3965 TaxID=2663120 RepID=UPI0012997B56
KRSSVKETYDRILTDLLLAIELLPSTAALPSRGAKVSAFALLARTSIAMEQYDKAGIYADSSLRLYNKLIDFNAISSTATNMGRFNVETIFYMQRSSDYLSTWQTDRVFVDQALFELYENDDLRKTRFFTIRNGNIAFKGNYNNSLIGFDGLATDEQYLIKAESLARSSSTAAAMEVLNTLLKTRWNNKVPYPVITAIDPEDALKKILTERRKELLFRNLRWMDLRRLNLDNRFKITLKRTIGGEAYTLEPDSYKYTLPLPDDIIAFSGMQQPPGWEK